MAIAGHGIQVESETTSSGGWARKAATIPTGKVLLGGGVTCADSRSRVVESGPTFANGVANGWLAAVQLEDPSSGTAQVNVFAIYADA